MDCRGIVSLQTFLPNREELERKKRMEDKKLIYDENTLSLDDKRIRPCLLFYLLHHLAFCLLQLVRTISSYILFFFSFFLYSFLYTTQFLLIYSFKLVFWEILCSWSSSLCFVFGYSSVHNFFVCNFFL